MEYLFAWLGGICGSLGAVLGCIVALKVTPALARRWRMDREDQTLLAIAFGFAGAAVGACGNASITAHYGSLAAVLAVLLTIPIFTVFAVLAAWLLTLPDIFGLLCQLRLEAECQSDTPPFSRISPEYIEYLRRSAQLTAALEESRSLNESLEESLRATQKQLKQQQQQIARLIAKQEQDSGLLKTMNGRLEKSQDDISHLWDVLDVD